MSVFIQLEKTCCGRAIAFAIRMQFFVATLALITLAVAVRGEQGESDGQAQRDYFQCGGHYCTDGFYCLHGNCYPKRRCSTHGHCLKDQYCDKYQQVCRKGVRRCSYHNQCGYRQICKGGKCKQLECLGHRDCPDSDACHYPPGICLAYKAYCHEGYNYCKRGYVCVNKTRRADWCQNASRSCYWDCYWGYTGQLSANFFPVPSDRDKEINCNNRGRISCCLSTLDL